MSEDTTVAIEKKDESTTKAIAKVLHENRVLVSILALFLTYVFNEFVFTRDQALVQPGVDQLQDYRLDHIETDIESLVETTKAMDGKLDALMQRQGVEF